jgi:hypothetical protein
VTGLDRRGACAMAACPHGLEGLQQRPAATLRLGAARWLPQARRLESPRRARAARTRPPGGPA